MIAPTLCWVASPELELSYAAPLLSLNNENLEAAGRVGRPHKHSLKPSCGCRSPSSGSRAGFPWPVAHATGSMITWSQGLPFPLSDGDITTISL